MVFHFSGRQNLDRPAIFLFPKVLVCLDCGFSRFTAPEADVALLAKGAVHLKPGNGKGVPTPSMTRSDFYASGMGDKS
jgi:hypothetical protein